MSHHLTLKNAPIQEGLIDLRTLFDAPPTGRAFEAISNELRATYPESSPLQQLTAHFQVGDAGHSQGATTQHRGMLLQSADKTFVFQAQVDGFTVSRLRPYTTWDDLLSEAKKLWLVFEKHTQPVTVNRVAVRYINCFELPEPIQNLSDFLQAPPDLPASLPQHLSNYLTRYQLPDPDTGATISLTQSMDDTGNNRKQFTIDIDAFKNAEFEAYRHEWWQLLDQLRHLKNRVFFASLTERTLDRFR